MEFGFSLPGRGPLATPEQILKLATRADTTITHAPIVRMKNTESANSPYIVPGSRIRATRSRTVARG